MWALFVWLTATEWSSVILVNTYIYELSYATEIPAYSYKYRESTNNETS